MKDTNRGNDDQSAGARDFWHIPALAEECIAGLCVKRGGVYVDCTVGGAGHALGILEKQYAEGAVLIGIDRDGTAVDAARRRLNEKNAALGGLARCEVAHSNFVDIENILGRYGIAEADGILFDLGVSSQQLDDADRGFSFLRDAPLDMRMDRDSPVTAADIVNGYSEKALADMIYKNSDERWASRIAKFIVDRRAVNPIRTTSDLTGAVLAAVPKGARQGSIHPATRTFLAVRVELNGELETLDRSIRSAAGLLKAGGRLCVVSFNSNEDRICKTVIKELSARCICPKDIPVCVCGRSAVLRQITRKPVFASEAESSGNARARSARLRVAEKLETV